MIVYTGVLQCVAVCCSVLQCVAACCSVLQCVAVCCSVLPCVAACCSVLRCDAVRCSVLQCLAVCRSVLQCAAVCCSVLQCAAVCRSSSSVLQCVAVCVVGVCVHYLRIHSGKLVACQYVPPCEKKVIQPCSCTANQLYPNSFFSMLTIFVLIHEFLNNAWNWAQSESSSCGALVCRNS